MARPPGGWRQYFGEEPEAGSSEDECYRTVEEGCAYTRSSVERRQRVWDEISAFEAGLERRSLMAPKHRGLCASVRPKPGAEAVVSFVARPAGGGKSEIFIWIEFLEIVDDDVTA